MEYEIVHTEEKEGFTLTLSFAPECYEPDWDMSDEQKQQLLDDINDGNLLWFCAKVECTKAGVSLANDYLGGCCYKNVNEFLTGGYYSDMVNTVIVEAKQTISILRNDK